MDEYKKDKLNKKEWERNPMSNFGDSVNRSMVGDPGALLNGGCLTKIITISLIIFIFFILSQCSR